MNRYSRSDWQRLGDIVSAARRADGFSDTQQWCEIVGRSDRMLLGLERGEPVGKGTLRLIEDALDWPAGHATRVLAGEALAGPARVATVAPSSIREASDEQLVEELRRRLAAAATTESEATSDGAPIVTATQDDEGTIKVGARPRRSDRGNGAKSAPRPRHTSGP